MRGLLWSEIVVWRGGLERNQTNVEVLEATRISDVLLHSDRTLAGVGVGDMCGYGGHVWKRFEDM